MPPAPRPPNRSQPPSRSHAPRSPLEGTDRLIVDGTNLLYRMGAGGTRGAGATDDKAPPAAIIGRLRALVPATVAIDVVFDGQGHGVFGRVAQGMYVRYSGRRPADDVILDIAAEATMEAGRGPAAAARVLVVSNDRGLRDRLLTMGSRTVPLQWLLDRLDVPRLSSPAPGNRRPPGGGVGQGSGARAQGSGDEGVERPGWKPGRGATSKTGPAHKIARHKRHPRAGA